MSWVDDFANSFGTDNSGDLGETGVPKSVSWVDQFAADFGVEKPEDTSLPYDGGFEDTGGTGYADTEYTPPTENPKGFSGAIDTVRDTGISAAKGIVGMPAGLVSLADAPTSAPAEALMGAADNEQLYNALQKSEGGRLGKLLEEAGYKPSEALSILDNYYSQKYKTAQRDFVSRETLTGKFESLGENPSLILNNVVESVPSMIGGQGLGKALMYGKGALAGGTLGKVLGISDDLLTQAPRLASYLAGAVGEGVMAAGSNAQQLEVDNKEGGISPGQYAAALGSGVTTFGFGALGGRIAQRAGFDDWDSFLLKKAGPDRVLSPSQTLTAAALNGLNESVLEELPQSLSEMALINISKGDPWYKGWKETTAMSTTTGFAMGAGMEGRRIFIPNTKEEADTILQDSGINPVTGELLKERVEVNQDKINKLLRINQVSEIERQRMYEDAQDAFTLSPDERASLDSTNKAAGKSAVEKLSGILPGNSAEESARVFREQTPFSQQVDETQAGFDETVNQVESMLKELAAPIKQEPQEDTPIPENGNTVDLTQYTPPAPKPQEETQYAPDQITNPDLISEIPYEVQQQTEAPPSDTEASQDSLSPQGQRQSLPADTATAQPVEVDTPKGKVFRVIDSTGSRLVKPEGATAVSPALSVDPKADAQGNAVYYDENTGAAIAKASDGKWVIDGIYRKFDSVAQASRALNTNPEIQQEVVQGFEGSAAEGLATSTSPEDILSAKDGAVKQILFDNEANSLQKVGSGVRRRVASNSPQNTPQGTPKQGQGLKESVGRGLVDAILNNEPQAVVEALSEFPSNNHKSVLRAAVEMAKSEAIQSGDYDVNVIEELNQEVSKDVVGKYTKKADVKWESEQGMSGLYTGTDPRSGRTFSLYETYSPAEVNSNGEETRPAGKYYVVSEGKNVLVDKAASLSEAKRELQGLVSRETEGKAEASGYRVVKVAKGEGGYTSRNTQYRVIGPDGKVVPTPEGFQGFEGKKAAEAHRDSLITGIDRKVSSSHTNKVSSDKAREFIKAQLEAEKQRAEANKSSEEAPGPVKTVKLSPEAIKEIEDRINNRIRSGFELDDSDFGPLVSETVTGRQVADLLVAKNSPYSTLLQTLRKEVGDGVFESITFQSHRTIGKDVPIEIKVRLERGGSWYHEKTHTVYYSPQASDRTLAHEMYHGLTMKILSDLKKNNSSPSLLARFNSLRQAFREELIKSGLLEDYHLGLIQSSKTQAELKENMKGLPILEQKLMYMLHRGEEFISIGLTEADVQSLLKNRSSGKGERKTLWRKFIEGVQSLFGKEEEGKDGDFSMLEELLSVTHELVAKQTTLVTDANGKPLSKVISNDDLEYDENNPSMNILEDLDKTPQEQLDAMMKSIKDNPVHPSEEKKMLSSLLTKGKDLLIRIDVEMESISPRLAHMLRVTEAEISHQNAGFAQSLKTFQRLTTKIRGAERVALNNALRVGNTEVRDLILTKYQAKNAFDNTIQPWLDQLREGYLETGQLQDSDLVDNWFPSEVGDLDGLIKATSEDPEMSMIQQEINSYMARHPGMDEKDVARTVLTRYMKTGRMNETMRVAKATKERKMAHVKPEWQGYYKDFIEVLANAVEEGHEAIAWRKLIGQTSIPRLKSEMVRLIDSLKYSKTDAERDGVISQIEVRTDMINDMEKFAAESVSDLVYSEAQSGGLTKSQQDRAVSLIRARLTQTGIKSAILRTARNASLAMTLGDALNTVTQANDIWSSVYQAGIGNTLKSFAQCISGSADVKITDFDLSRALTEFRSINEKGNFLSLPAIFRRTGFTALDSFMKQVNMQSHINKGRSLVSTEKGEAKFRDKYEKAWGKEMADSVIKDLKAGIINYDTKLYAVTELSKTAPIFLIGMPKKFITGGDWRVAYTLSSYTLSVFSLTMYDGVKRVVKGKGFERVEGLKNLAALAILMGLCNVGVGELKEWMKDPLRKGKGAGETTFMRKFADGVLSLFMLSNYKLETLMGRDGVEKYALGFAPPIVGIAGTFTTDVKNMISGKTKDITDVKSLRYIPAVIPFVPASPGRVLYYVKGAEGSAARSMDSDRNEIFGKLKGLVQEGKPWVELKPLINEYNSKARQIKGASMITNETLARRAKAIKNQMGDRPDIFKEYKEFVTKGEPVTEEFRKKVREYNIAAREKGYNPITPKDLTQAKKRYSK